MEDTQAVVQLLKLAEESGAKIADRVPLVLEFGIPELMKFSEHISEKVFKGTCAMIIQSIAVVANHTTQEVDLARSVTKEELDGTGRTGSH